MAEDNHRKPDQAFRRKTTAYLSNFRSSLTGLVILHHAACSYGGIGRSVYQSRFHAQASSLPLVGFNALNQSFFMGSFMFLGGHFTQKSLKNKSKSQLVHDRLWRLGVPAIAYTLFGAPFCRAVIRVASGQRLAWSFFTDYWKSLREVRGPIWFTATLLVFDLSLVGFTKVKEYLGFSPNSTAPPPTSDFDGHRGVDTTRMYFSLCLCSVADFLIRIRYPVGVAIGPLQVQPAYLTQYVASYVWGVCTETVEEAIPTAKAMCGLGIVSGLSTFFLGRSLRNDPSATDSMAGGWNNVAACYAIWNNTTGYLVASSLLSLFSTHFNRNWKTVNEFAYPAFLLHMPVLTIIQEWLDHWDTEGVMKTVLVGALATAGSWITGFAANSLWTKLIAAARAGR